MTDKFSQGTSHSLEIKMSTGHPLTLMASLRIHNDHRECEMLSLECALDAPGFDDIGSKI